MELAEKIQMQRKKEGLSQEAFAEKMGVSRQAVSKWELGITKPDVDKIVMMSDLFGVSTDYLLKNQADNEQKERVVYYREVIPWEFEKKSRHQLFGLPLYHIYFSGTRSGGRIQMKMKTAKGTLFSWSGKPWNFLSRGICGRHYCWWKCKCWFVCIRKSCSRNVCDRELCNCE